MRFALHLALACATIIGAALAQSPAPLIDHSRAASEALFSHSDIGSARSEAAAALRLAPRDTRALFVEMEAAALDADNEAVLRAATRLCSAVQTAADEDMCEIAAARISDLAANTREFRNTVPTIRQLISSGSSASSQLRLALVAAASDQAPEFDILRQARESGLLTDWKLVGPLGRYPNSDFDRAFGPENDGMRKRAYSNKSVTSFLFSDGKVDLPASRRAVGVYYAAADLMLGTTGEWRVWIDTPGTLEVFIDGKSVLRKDTRAADLPRTQWTLSRIDSGRHRVVVKFLPSALPFHVAVMAPTAGVRRKNSKPQVYAGPEAEYSSVALRYWRKDYVGAARELSRNSALATLPYATLLAQLWVKITGPNSPRSVEALRAAAKISTNAGAVQLLMAQRYAAADRVDDLLPLLKAILARRPDDADALALFAQTAATLEWKSEATEAYDRLLAAHPSCANVRDAASYFDKTQQFRRADALAPQLQRCTPPSNIHLDERMQANARTSQNPRAAGFFDGAEFFAPYRRDGVKLVRDLESRRFSGGLSVLLLNDKVALLTPGNQRAVYVHTITRLLDRQAIDKLGEVVVPPGADLLELRTIKPDGTTIEPELNDHKATISMPALSPGDAIEQEYVVWLGPTQHVDDDLFAFAFGSFVSPMVISRFVAISPRDAQIEASGATPKPTEIRASDGTLVRVWERSDIPQSTNEGQLPRVDLFPIVRLARGTSATGHEFDLHLRELSADSSRVGLYTALDADKFASYTGEELARRLYTDVVTTITQDDSDFAEDRVTSAENTLAAREGSRAAALLALSRATGLHADLAFARPLADGSSALPTHPLVVFHVNGRDIVTDPDSNGMPFGILSPLLDRSHATLIRGNIASDFPLPSLEAQHLSSAEGDLVVGSSGSFTAHVKITMGAWRAAQMRDILRTIPANERPQFFEQLSLRLFPGAIAAEGMVHNETNLDQPLALEISCTAPHFFKLTGSQIDIDQLVPTLGLRRMFATRSSRKFPLFIDSLLFESALFRVHLPAGVRSARLAPSADLRTMFGDYLTSFTSAPDGVLVIRREFRVPVQIVTPDAYLDFAAFASRIDDIERQRLTLSIDHAILSAQK